MSVTHWQSLYGKKEPPSLSWYQAQPTTSLALIEQAALPLTGPVIDVGGGTSTLVDHLLAQGFADVSVLDLSSNALSRSRARLGAAAAAVTWLVADVTHWKPTRRYQLWHDRAAFHFLTAAEDRAAYVRALHDALAPGGWAVVASFASDGPERCSGLPVRRYVPHVLAAELRLELVDSVRERHLTPAGVAQSFQYSLLRRP